MQSAADEHTESTNESRSDREIAEKAPSYRFDGLTGLRFFAAFFVFLGHSDQFLLFDPTTMMRQWSLGVCVTLFFVLSGFVLTHAYNQLPTAFSIRDFLVARLAKIWPIHAVTLVLFIIGMKLQPADLNPLQILASLFLVQDWVPLRKFFFAFNTPAWSLSAEFFFYLLFPVIIQKQKRYLTLFLIAAYIITAICVIGSDPIFPAPQQDEVRQFFAYWSPIPRVADFILGMQTYVLFERHAHKIRQLKLPWTLLELGTSLILLAWTVEGKILANQLLSSGIAENTSRSGLEIWLASAAPAIVCAFLIFLVALGKGALSKIVSSKLAVDWGDRSYALYMIHFPVFALILNSQIGWQPLPPLLLFCATSVICFVGSDFLYRMVELPAREYIRDKFTSKKRLSLESQKSKLAIGLTFLQAAAMSTTIGAFYFYDEIVHHRQRGMNGSPVTFSQQTELESAYWEHDAERAVLELNWRNLNDSKLHQAAQIQLLNAKSVSAKSPIKAQVLPLEDAGMQLKNQSLKMRVELPLTALEQASHVRVTVAPVVSDATVTTGNPGTVANTGALKTLLPDSTSTSLVMPIPDSFNNLSSHN